MTGQLRGRTYTRCNRWRENLLQKATSGRYEVVVTSSSSFIGVSAQRMPMHIVGPDGQVLQGQQADEAWRAGYQRTLQRLQQAGVAVVVIRDTPLMRRPVPECLARFPKEAHRCSPSLWRAEPGSEDVRLAEELGVTTGDFTDVFCSQKCCNA